MSTDQAVELVRHIVTGLNIRDIAATLTTWTSHAQRRHRVVLVRRP
ncbi:hypothetical protein [Streptomyces sp. NPDC094032]